MILYQYKKQKKLSAHYERRGALRLEIITYRQKMAADSRAVESGEFWRIDQEIKTKEVQLSRINALRSTWWPLD